MLVDGLRATHIVDYLSVNPIQDSKSTMGLLTGSVPVIPDDLSAMLSSGPDLAISIHCKTISLILVLVISGSKTNPSKISAWRNCRY